MYSRVQRIEIYSWTTNNREFVNNTVSLNTHFLNYVWTYLSLPEISSLSFKNLKDYVKHGLRYTYFIAYRTNQNEMIICVFISNSNVQKIQQGPIIQCIKLV